MKKLKELLSKYGVIANEEVRKRYTNLYIEQRLWLSTIFTIIFLVAAINIACRWKCLGIFPLFRGGLTIGLLGLTVRSWSYLNQGESPFPPYILTYPILIVTGCLFIVCAALQKIPLEHHWMAPFIVAAPCFVLGYGPMDFLGKWRQ